MTDFTDRTDKGTGKIRSLRELPQDIAPPRDLWQGIEAQLRGRSDDPVTGAKPVSRMPRLRLFAAAAVVAALAIGVWIGRSVLPFTGRPASNATPAVTANQPEALGAAYVMDAKYTRERAALVRSLEAQLANLPPDSRAKVVSSLTTIQNSMRDLEAALGRDPSNALLQELLVNTYQDEMRVLTAVHEAGEAGKGI